MQFSFLLVVVRYTFDDYNSLRDSIKNAIPMLIKNVLFLQKSTEMDNLISTFLKTIQTTNTSGDDHTKLDFFYITTN